MQPDTPTSPAHPPIATAADAPPATPAPALHDPLAPARQAQAARPLRLQTRLVRAGRAADTATPSMGPAGRAVNPPLVRASTVLFDSVASQREMRARRGRERLFTYGARGTPTTFALEDAITELEGGHRSRLFPTGLAAVGMALLAYLRPGDHLLLSDAVYEPVRHLAGRVLPAHGIECSFFRPDGQDLARQLRPHTRMVYAECPGSLVYEMCDLPALAALAHAHGAWLAVDNTWGSGCQYRPLTLGADISIMAATKYLSGHSDVMMGSVCTTEAAWQPLAEHSDAFGMTVSPDDAWLVLRGLRSLAARLALHERHALQLARWLQARPEVATVFHPALPGHPGHALWRRDCQGSNGLLSFELQPGLPAQAAEQWIDRLRLFGIGASWGGFESLAILADMTRARSLESWAGRGAVLRLHAGLEDPQDLQDDLAQAFDGLAPRAPGGAR